MVWTFATASARDTRCLRGACPIATWSPAAGPRRLFTVDHARSLPLRLVIGGRLTLLLVIVGNAAAVPVAERR